MTTTPTADRAVSRVMTTEEREQFERDGFVIIRNVLTPDEVAHYAAAVDRVYAEHEAVGKLGPDRSLHKLSAVARWIFLEISAIPSFSASRVIEMGLTASEHLPSSIAERTACRGSSSGAVSGSSSSSHAL